MTQAVLSAPSKLLPLEQHLEKLGFRGPTVLLSVEQSLGRISTVRDFTLSEAFRQTWTCQPLKKKFPPVVAVCHSRGAVIKVYQNVTWIPAWKETQDRFERMLGGIVQLIPDSDREAFVKKVRCQHDELVNILRSRDDLWNFIADEAPDYDHVYKTDLSPWLTQRGMANPVRYVNCG